MELQQLFRYQEKQIGLILMAENHIFGNIYSKCVVILSKNKTNKSFTYMESVKAIKPSPEGINTIIKEFGYDKTECIMIGDNPRSDGDAASAAGIDFYLI